MPLGETPPYLLRRTRREPGSMSTGARLIAVKSMKDVRRGAYVKTDAQNSAEAHNVQASVFRLSIGIADPFYPKPIIPAGEWFWVCLNPLPEDDDLIPPVPHKKTISVKIGKRVKGQSVKAQSVKALRRFRAAQTWLKDHCYMHCPDHRAIPDHGLELFCENVRLRRIVYEIIYPPSDPCSNISEVKGDPDELFRYLNDYLSYLRSDQPAINADYFFPAPPPVPPPVPF